MRFATLLSQNLTPLAQLGDFLWLRHWAAMEGVLFV
jgi:hypothetical protein